MLRCQVGRMPPTSLINVCADFVDDLFKRYCVIQEISALKCCVPELFQICPTIFNMSNNPQLSTTSMDHCCSQFDKQEWRRFTFFQKSSFSYWLRAEQNPMWLGCLFLQKFWLYTRLSPPELALHSSYTPRFFLWTFQYSISLYVITDIHSTSLNLWSVSCQAHDIDCQLVITNAVTSVVLFIFRTWGERNLVIFMHVWFHHYQVSADLCSGLMSFLYSDGEIITYNFASWPHMIAYSSFISTSDFFCPVLNPMLRNYCLHWN